jgi:hypothetical protein
MNKSQKIERINSLIADNKIDFDAVDPDVKMKASEVTDLLADVEEAVAELNAPPTVTVAALCKEAGKDPKTVRARLRRMYAADDTSDLPVPVTGKQRWTFAEDDREAVEALIANA